MSEPNRMRSTRLAVFWVVVFALVFLGFYGLDHLVMNLQGLPLDWDLSPAG